MSIIPGHRWYHLRLPVPYRWYDRQPWWRLALARWSFFRKHWHSQAKRLARPRSLYWVLLRGHDSEICARCGGPVKVVYWAPDELWASHSGFKRAERTPGGESGGGVLCPPCFTDLAGWPLFWTCSRDEMLMPYYRPGGQGRE